jgi:hypothetical protein
MKDFSKSFAKSLFILLAFNANISLAVDFTHKIYRCNGGSKLDCSDCEKSRVDSEVKYLIDANKRYILITQKNRKNEVSSYELENCRIYSNENWVCKYPRKTNEPYDEDMLYQVTEGYLKFEFKSQNGTARLCGVKNNF